MAGIFSKSSRPKLPGAYFNFEARAVVPVPVNPGSIVAIPFTHDWGPFEEVSRTGSFAEWQAIYGNADDTDGYRAVRQAFEGSGLVGQGGAGEVLSFRMGGSAAAKSTKALSNGTTTAITLQARYEGTRGDDLRVTVQDSATAGSDELLIYDGAVLLERYQYVQTDITTLAADIREFSDWVDYTGAITSGTALTAVASQAFTGGNDGTTLLAADYTAAMTAFEVEPFGVVAPYNLTDSGILASFAAWTDDLNDAGKYHTLVVGGAAGESVSTAATRSGTLASPNIINVGVGTIRDLDLGADRTELDIGTAQLAPRIAGILAARGEHQSLTHARLAGVEIVVGATVSDLETAFDEGVVVLARDSHATAPVHVKTGLTTWTSSDADADASKPYLIYRQPKYVATMHGIGADLTRWAEENIIGQRPINEATRTALIAEVKSRLTEREASGSIQSGWSVSIDQDPPPTPEDEFIALAITVSFARSLEQVYFTVSVG